MRYVPQPQWWTAPVTRRTLLAGAIGAVGTAGVTVAATWPEDHGGKRGSTSASPPGWPANHQVLPRDAAGFCQLRYLLPGSSTGLSLRVLARSGNEVPVRSTVRRTARGQELFAWVPTGGPYAMALASQNGGTLAAAEDVWVGDLWVLAGQSNMAGGGLPLPAPESSDQTRMLSFDGAWKSATEPLHRMFESVGAVQFRLYPTVTGTGAEAAAEEFRRAAAAGAGSSIGGVGPGLFFARKVRELVGVPVGLIPCAMPASSLEMWMPGWKAPDGVPANLFTNMVNRARAAGGVRGVVWYQGESDTTPDKAATYERRFAQFVDRLRLALGDPSLPVLTVQLAGTTTWPSELEPSWGAVRDAQRRAAAAIPAVALVAAAGLPLQDGVHLSAAGQAVLGRRLAMAATAAVPGRHRRFGVPHLREVRVAGNDVLCRFDGVNGRLRVPNEAHRAFSADGAIRSIHAAGTDTVAVTVDGPITSLGYCLRYDDIAAIKDEQDLPVPAFGPIAATAATAATAG